MSTKEIGQAILLASLMFSVAGMVEPTWWSSLIVGVLTVSAFLIWVSGSYRDWSNGYERGLDDAARDRAEQERITREISLYEAGSDLWKCGMDDCTCVNDSRYKEHADD